MKLTVVSTLYNSEDHLATFLSRMHKVTAKLFKADFEIILVDDGSKDDSLQIALNVQNEMPQLKVIELSRNFGHHKAIRTGLEAAKGDLIFLIDCDLEEAPELLEDFYNRMSANKSLDSVFGVQKQRKGKFMERLMGGLFWQLFNYLTQLNIPLNVSTVRLMNKNFQQAILSYQEKEYFFNGVGADVGFCVEAYYFTKGSRETSSYTFKKRFNLMLNAITAFSNRPLILIVYAGLFISASTALSAFVVMFRKVILQIDFQLGWASVILSIWFLGGLILFVLGIIGIYLSKVFMEVKQRPLTIIRRVHELKSIVK